MLFAITDVILLGRAWVQQGQVEWAGELLSQAGEESQECVCVHGAPLPAPARGGRAPLRQLPGAGDQPRGGAHSLLQGNVM